MSFIWSRLGGMNDQKEQSQVQQACTKNRENLKEPLSFWISYSCPYLMPPLTKTPPPHLNGSVDGLSQSNSLDYLIHSYPYLDLEVTSDNLFEGAWNVVSSVFPIWKRNNVKFTQCKDGITNQCKCMPYIKSMMRSPFWSVDWPISTSSYRFVVVRVVHTLDDVSVLVRAYGKGSEIIIDRKQELIVSVVVRSLWYTLACDIVWSHPITFRIS